MRVLKKHRVTSKEEDVPREVAWVWGLQYIGYPVGSKTYNMALDIVNRYPQYFKWEHTYNSIPQSVHDAFREECRATRPSRGLPIWHTTPTTLAEMLNAVEKNIQDEQKTCIADEKRIKKIWDKYYSKYNLEYRH